MALITNTGAVGGGNGLNGVAAIFDNEGAGIDWENPQNVGAAVNAELLYLTNLWRQARGLPPVDPAHAAPTVNVGLSPEVKNVMLIGGAVLLAFVLMSRKRS